MTKKAPKTEYVIELKNLSRDFGFGEANVAAVNKVNLKIKYGEFVAIMGPSGCGKTTLLNTLGLLDQTYSGQYILDGQDITKMSRTKKAKLRNQKIGFVFQNFNIIPRLNVIENVALPLVYSGVSRIKSLERASEMLKKFKLNQREYYMPWQLSGGQVQRIAIARALINKPSIILADEPTGSLDSKSSHIIMEELAKIHQQGQTIILVTHNPNLISYADRVINMVDGRIDSNIDKTKTPTKKIPTPKDLDSTTDDLNYLFLLQTINQLAEKPATKASKKVKINFTLDDDFHQLKVKYGKPKSKITKKTTKKTTKTAKKTVKKSTKKAVKKKLTKTKKGHK